jgi:Ca2+-binding EF-hand superfamily protein
MDALDLNKDGELDAREIQQAPMSLRKLDTNKDFKLTRDELSGGRGGPGGNMVDRMMEMDTNKDGKLSGDEIPERMQGFLDRIDLNGDGAIDKKEMEEMQNRMQERFGDRGPGGDRGEGRPPREGGNQ